MEYAQVLRDVNRVAREQGIDPDQVVRTVQGEDRKTYPAHRPQSPPSPPAEMATPVTPVPPAASVATERQERERRWREAVTTLQDIQEAYRQDLDALPDDEEDLMAEDRREQLRAVCELDLDDVARVWLP